MAGSEKEMNTTKNIKSSLLGVIIKAQSSLSPTRKSDSSLVKTRPESSKQSENHLSQKLWFSLKKLSSSASDFSKHAPISLSTYFSSSSTSSKTVTRTSQPSTPSTTTSTAPFPANSSSSNSVKELTIAEREETLEDRILAESNTLLESETFVVSASISPSLSSDTEHLSTTACWHVTPATPETASAGTPAEESPVFDWSTFDWKEGESNPPRGLIFPFPIRPLSRTQSCGDILMGCTGSSEFEF